MPAVSVIIPTYNSESTLKECLLALFSQTYPKDNFEIIIVDDGSIDNTKELVGQYPDIKYFWQPNQGPSAARNAGARYASGDIIVFTDSDCIAQPDWLEKMVKPFENADVIGVKGIYLTRQKELLARFAQKEFEERYRLLSKYPSIDFVDSYSAAFRKKAFLDVGGFDTKFWVANNEDVELSYKLAAKGYKMVFATDAVVYHKHSANLLDYLRLKFSRAYWRMLVYKRFPKKVLRDTYTPITLKLEFFMTLLIFISILAYLITLIFPNRITEQIPFALLTLIFLGLLFLSTLPLSLRILGEDFQVGLLAPFILIGRSIVFLFGTIFGILAFFTESFREKIYPVSKRIFDIAIAFGTLLVIAPLFVLIGLAIRLDSAGPVVFRHRRLGKDGRFFTFYKFRTMIKDAESKKNQLRNLSNHKGPVFKIKNDPRITRIGKLLRRFSFDELPQLFNVLNGTMSLVGPRPLPEIDILHPELLNPKEAEIDQERLQNWLQLRQSVPPGITGLWQVRGRSDLPLEAWFNYDIEYLNRRSFWMDIKILIRTIPIVLIGKGAQ